MVQRLEKGCHNLDHRVLQWESHFPAKKQQFHSNPRFNKSYFVHVRSIDDSWHECMILITELGANLRYAIYFEMRSELRTPPCWNAFSQCKMVWWLFERNSSLPNSGAACFCSFLPCLGYQEWEQRQLRQHRERQHRETSWTRNLLGWGLPWGQSSQCQNDRKYCTQYCQNNSFLLDGQEEEMLGKLRQSLILKLALARSRVGREFLRCVKNIGNQSAAASPDRRNPLGSLQLWNIPRRWYSRDIPTEATLSAFNWYRFVSPRVNAVVSGKKQTATKRTPWQFSIGHWKTF